MKKLNKPNRKVAYKAMLNAEYGACFNILC
jgi:hypothetical protein